MHEDLKLPKNLNGSNWTQIRLEMRAETLLFCCTNNTDIKYGLAGVGSTVQLL